MFLMKVLCIKMTILHFAGPGTVALAFIVLGCIIGILLIIILGSIIATCTIYIVKRFVVLICFQMFMLLVFILTFIFILALVADHISARKYMNQKAVVMKMRNYKKLSNITSASLVLNFNAMNCFVHFLLLNRRQILKILFFFLFLSVTYIVS